MLFRFLEHNTVIALIWKIDSVELLQFCLKNSADRSGRRDNRVLPPQNLSSIRSWRTRKMIALSSSPLDFHQTSHSRPTLTLRGQITSLGCALLALHIMWRHKGFSNQSRKVREQDYLVLSELVYLQSHESADYILYVSLSILLRYEKWKFYFDITA